MYVFFVICFSRTADFESGFLYVKHVHSLTFDHCLQQVVGPMSQQFCGCVSLYESLSYVHLLVTWNSVGRARQAA